MNDGYWYLATPYSKYPGGLDAAFNAACKVAAKLIGKGELIYSPIAHTHPIASKSWLDPSDHDIWLRLDEPLMHGAKGIIVAKLPTWEISFGVAFEIDWFTKAGRPIRYLELEEISDCQ